MCSCIVQYALLFPHIVLLTMGPARMTAEEKRLVREMHCQCRILRCDVWSGTRTKRIGVGPDCTSSVEICRGGGGNPAEGGMHACLKGRITAPRQICRHNAKLGFGCIYGSRTPPRAAAYQIAQRAKVGCPTYPDEVPGTPLA